MTKNQNAFETTLASQFGPSDLTANVATLGTLTSPCYMVFEPTSDAQREVVYFDGTFGASSFVTTSTANRYLPGSAAGSGLTHPAGATVRSVILSQHLDDLYQYVDNLDHSALSGLNVGDIHPQYVLEADHTTAGSHDALGINADKVDGLHAAAFAVADHSHDSPVVAANMQGNVYGNATTSWATQASIAVTIPAGWNTYDVLVQFSKEAGTGAATSLSSRIKWNGSAGAATGTHAPSTVQTTVGVADTFAGETATGARTATLEIQTNASECVMKTSVGTIIAIRRS